MTDNPFPTAPPSYNKHIVVKDLEVEINSTFLKYVSPMHCHLMVYMRIVITTLLILTCLLGDNFVDLTQHPLLKALADNATHATVGALSGIVFAMQFYDRTTHFFGWILIFGASICSSLIDIDHFLATKSWSLEEAVNLPHRPLLHCSTIIPLLVIAYCCACGIDYFKSSLLLGIVLCAFITHHTRDAIRRGYWLYPWGSTGKLPKAAYIFITILTPYLLVYLHGLSRTPLVQQYLGLNTKATETSKNYKDSRPYRYATV